MSGLVALVLPAIGIGTAVATTTPRTTTIVVHSHGHTCRNTIVNGINDKGTALGTADCGNDKVFLRTKSGKLTTYKLPRKYATITQGSNISSNGILAVEGSQSSAGPQTGYLVAPDGHITVLNDPSAGGFSTIVNGVNRHGDAVGFYCLDATCREQNSFIYRHRTGKFTDFTIHRSTLALPTLSQILDNGNLIGYAFHAPNAYYVGFVRSPGRLKLVNAPGAPHKAGEGTLLLGGANHGALCGGVLYAHRMRGLVRFGGTTSVLDFYPNAAKPLTEVLGCNDHREYGGAYTIHQVHVAFVGKFPAS